MIIEAVIFDFRITVVAYEVTQSSAEARSDAQPNQCKRFTTAAAL